MNRETARIEPDYHTPWALTIDSLDSETETARRIDPGETGEEDRRTLKRGEGSTRVARMMIWILVVFSEQHTRREAMGNGEEGVATIYGRARHPGAALFYCLALFSHLDLF